MAKLIAQGQITITTMPQNVEVRISNPTVAIPCNADGTMTTGGLTSAKTKFTVFVDGVELSGDKYYLVSALPTNCTYTVDNSPSGKTVEILSIASQKGIVAGYVDFNIGRLVPAGTEGATVVNSSTFSGLNQTTGSTTPRAGEVMMDLGIYRFSWSKQFSGNGILTFTTTYNYPQTEIDRFGAAGYSGTWIVVESTSNVNVGDTVNFKVRNTTKNCDTFITAKVNPNGITDKTITATSIGFYESGSSGDNYSVNITGGIRGVAYAVNGQNPNPAGPSTYTASITKNGQTFTPYSISWSVSSKGILSISGSSNATTVICNIATELTSANTDYPNSAITVSIVPVNGAPAITQTIPIIVTRDIGELDWISDWEGNKVTIGTNKIVTPKIFAGAYDTTKGATGVAIGRDVLPGGLNKTIGIIGYKENKAVFGLDQFANFYVSSSGTPGDVASGAATGLYYDSTTGQFNVTGKLNLKALGSSSFTPIENIANINNNLIANTTSAKDKYLDSTGALIVDTAWDTTDFIPVDPSTDYVVSGYTNLGYAQSTCFYTAARNLLTADTITNNNPMLNGYLGAGIYQQTDPLIKFSASNWTSEDSTAYSGGSGMWTTTSGAYCEFKFYGTGFELYIPRAVNRGNAKIEIDGQVIQASLSQYNSSTIINAKWYTSPVLTLGQHTARITCLNTKETNATSTAIIFDRVTILGTAGGTDARGGVFKTPRNAAFMKFSYIKNDIGKIKLEKGAIPTSFSESPIDAKPGVDNLQPNADFTRDPEFDGWTGGQLTNITIDPVVESPDGYRVVRLLRTNWTSGTLYLFTATDRIRGSFNDLFTISFEYFIPEGAAWLGDINNTFVSGIWNYKNLGNSYTNVGSDRIYYRPQDLIVGKWTKITYTARVSQIDTETVSLVFGMARNIDIYITKPKIERGPVATDFTLGEVDIKYANNQTSIVANGANAAAGQANANISRIALDIEGDIKLRGDLIADGSITSAAINTGSFTIVNDDGQETFAIDEDGNVRLDGDLKSSNFNNDRSLGYKITRNGEATFNQVTVRGDVQLPNAGMTNFGDTIGNENLLSPSTNLVNVGAITTNYSNYLSTGEFTMSNLSLSTDGVYFVMAPILGNKTTLFTMSFDIKRTAGSLTKIGGHTEALSTVANTFYIDGVKYSSDDATLPVAQRVSWASGAVNNMLDDGQWHRVVVPVSYTYSTTNAPHRFYLQPNRMIAQSCSVAIRGLKVEYGDQDTPWCVSTKDQGNFVRLWAGSSYETRNNAPFRVLQNGDVYASNGVFSGIMTGLLDNDDIQIYQDRITINKPKSQGETEIVNLNSNGQCSFNCNMTFGSSSDKGLEYINTSKRLTLNTDTIMNGGTTQVSIDSGTAWNTGGLNLFSNLVGNDAKFTFNFRSASTQQHIGTLWVLSHGVSGSEFGDICFRKTSWQNDAFNLMVQGSVTVRDSVRSRFDNTVDRHNIEMRSIAREGWGFYLVE